MKGFEDIEILDCPICQGTGLIQEESGWCVYVECLNCGSHTAELSYNTEEERKKAAQGVADLWNLGKVIVAGAGD